MDNVRDDIKWSFALLLRLDIKTIAIKMDEMVRVSEGLWMKVCVSEGVSERMNEWRNEWMKEWESEKELVNEWLSEGLSQVCQWLKEWVNKKVIEWRNKWVKENNDFTRENQALGQRWMNTSLPVATCSAIAIS